MLATEEARELDTAAAFIPVPMLGGSLVGTSVLGGAPSLSAQAVARSAAMLPRAPSPPPPPAPQTPAVLAALSAAGAKSGAAGKPAADAIGEAEPLLSGVDSAHSVASAVTQPSAQPAQPSLFERSVPPSRTYAVVLGDLNYRLRMAPEQAVAEIAAAEVISRRGELLGERAWHRLLVVDELRNAVARGAAFPGFSEAAICFPPTYRRSIANQAMLRVDRAAGSFEASATVSSIFGLPKPAATGAEADSDSAAVPKRKHKGKIRTPSYTDRVLLRRPNAARPRLPKAVWTSYRSCEAVTGSDHVPVGATFVIDLTRRAARARKRIESAATPGAAASAIDAALKTVSNGHTGSAAAVSAPGWKAPLDTFSVLMPGVLGEALESSAREGVEASGDVRRAVSASGARALGGPGTGTGTRIMRLESGLGALAAASMLGKEAAFTDSDEESNDDDDGDADPTAGSTAKPLQEEKTNPELAKAIDARSDEAAAAPAADIGAPTDSTGRWSRVPVPVSVPVPRAAAKDATTGGGSVSALLTSSSRADRESVGSAPSRDGPAPDSPSHRTIPAVLDGAEAAARAVMQMQRACAPVPSATPRLPSRDCGATGASGAVGDDTQEDSSAASSFSAAGAASVADSLEDDELFASVVPPALPWQARGDAPPWMASAGQISSRGCLEGMWAADGDAERLDLRSLRPAQNGSWETGAHEPTVHSSPIPAAGASPRARITVPVMQSLQAVSEEGSLTPVHRESGADDDDATANEATAKASTVEADPPPTERSRTSSVFESAARFWRERASGRQQ
jgi:hypothetical protein